MLNTNFKITALGLLVSLQISKCQVAFLLLILLQYQVPGTRYTGILVRLFLRYQLWMSGPAAYQRYLLHYIHTRTWYPRYQTRYRYYWYSYKTRTYWYEEHGVYVKKKTGTRTSIHDSYSGTAVLQLVFDKLVDYQLRKMRDVHAA